MKDYKLLSLNGEFYIQASRYYIAEPDASYGVNLKSNYIIAKDFNHAQELLIAELKTIGFYNNLS